MKEGLIFATLAVLLLTLDTGTYGQRVCPTRGFGKSAFSFVQKIEGGSDAEPGRYPYMTTLQRPSSRKHFCGAILIGKDMLLTAAHCVDSRSLNTETRPFIQIGGTSLSDDLDAESHQACRLIVHDKYTANVPGLGFDIALIQLVGSSQKTPVKLHESTEPVEGEVVAMGWGRDQFGNLPVNLKEVELDITEQSDCKNVFERLLLDSMICANRAGRDVCQGDSGGPLIIPGGGCGGNDMLVGITSFGFACASSGLDEPGIYTRVKSYMDWIKSYGAGASNVSVNAECRKPPPRGDASGTIIPTEPPAKTDLDPARDEGGCVFVEGIDFGKGPMPINDGKKDVFDTPQECCDLCKRTPGCRTWTYIRVEEKFSPKGACYLRAVQAPAIRCSICTSGLVKQDFLSEPETTCNYFLGMDLFGEDLEITRADRVEDCCDKCKKDKRCRSMTFTTDDKKCFLKSGIGELSICSRCHSAIMFDRVKSSDSIAVLNELLPGEELRIQNLKQTTVKGECRFTIGVDMDSQGRNILVDGKNNLVNTPEDCCEQCRNTRGCRSWTIVSVPTRRQKRGACFLRSNVPEEVPCAGCTSGVVQGQGTSSLAQSQCSLLEGVDLEGGDIRSGFVTDSPKECCDECGKLKGCKSWTRLITTGQCFLKNKAAPTPRVCYTCDSGVLMDRVTSKELAPLRPVLK
ncbi:hypothetical protein BSKO_00149 [Bryopsis sp. KO-2023]|nr:hypothetical protein BSKO_00149 [Bryopsis sp. KO-2023]